jgi:hypothetical protein
LSAVFADSVFISHSQSGLTAMSWSVGADFMTYRGVVSNGVVVLEGSKPAEGTIVEVTSLEEPASAAPGPADHPAIGIWKDRTDLPADSVEASKFLRQRLMRAEDE